MLRDSRISIAVFCLMALAEAVLIGWGFVAGPLALWVRSSSFVAADGVVTSAAVVPRPGSQSRRAPTNEFRCTYQYEVGGTTYSASRLTIADTLANHGTAATWWAGRLPEGARVRVWHDRADPGEALLDRRVPGAVLWFAAIGGLFWAGAVMFGMDAIDAIVWRSRRLAAGVFVREQAAGAILRVRSHPPVAVAAAWGGGVAVVAGLVAMPLMVLARSPFAPWWLVGLLAGLPALVAAGVFVHERYLWMSGRRDVVVDTAMGTLSLPPGPARPGAVSIPLADIVEIEVVTWENPVQAGNGVTVDTYTHVPTVTYRPALGAWRTAHIVEWRDEEKAIALARWLRERCGRRSARVGAGGKGLGGEPLGSVMEGIDEPR